MSSSLRSSFGLARQKSETGSFKKQNCFAQKQFKNKENAMYAIDSINDPTQGMVEGHWGKYTPNGINHPEAPNPPAPGVEFCFYPLPNRSVRVDMERLPDSVGDRRLLGAIALLQQEVVRLEEKNRQLAAELKGAAKAALAIPAKRPWWRWR